MQCGFTVTIANLAFLDHDGCARKRTYVAFVDASDATVNSDRIFLPWRVCARLRVYHTSARNDSLRILGQRVCLDSLHVKRHLPSCRYFTSPDVPLPAYPEGFQGMSFCYLVGRCLTCICRKRYSSRRRCRGEVVSRETDADCGR